MIFVCPHFEGMDERMAQFARLYAFPGIPGPLPPPGDDFNILDSGAWGLAQRGAQMTPAYMQRLAEHYRRYGDEQVYCIAPDVYLDPYQTMANWRWWQKQAADVPIVPVIQFERERVLDLFVALNQARFYALFAPQFVAISNPGLRAIESQSMPEICRVVREVTAAVWLHNLGAGWSPDDIRAWREFGCFDSIDSVSYYEDARRGWRWRVDGKRELVGGHWGELAHHNAQVAVEIAKL